MQGQGPQRPGGAPANTSAVRRPGGPGVEETIATLPVPEGFEPRDGDVLVVAYPEVTLPLKVQFAILKVGGISYRRQLRAGDDVNETYARINTWLSKQVENDIARKARAYLDELTRQKREG